VTKFDPYPLPGPENNTSSLLGSKYFSVLDCYSGFWQINISEEHKKLTGFTVPSGHYEFNRLPFGLSSSSANFQMLMDIDLKDLVATDCCIYLDDLILFSKRQRNTRRNRKESWRDLKVQISNYTPGSAQPQVKYLGYVLSEGVSASSDKIDAVRNYPTPVTRKTLGHSWDLRRFMADPCQNLLNRRNRSLN